MTDTAVIFFLSPKFVSFLCRKLPCIYVPPNMMMPNFFFLPSWYSFLFVDIDMVLFDFILGNVIPLFNFD